MKKLFFVFLLLSFISAKSFAQSFNGGLIVGPTFCQVDGDHYAGFHQLGFTAGAYANLPVAEHLSTQLELKYSLLGAHSSDIEVNEYYYNPYSLRLHYAEIPLMLQYNLIEVNEYYYNPYSLRLHYAEIPLMLQYNLGNFRVGGRPLDFLTLEAGISADVRLKATEDVDGDYQITTTRWNLLSATANAGIHVAFNDHLGLGARFMYSAMPIRFTGNPGWFYNQYYNKVVQFTLTYNINSPIQASRAQNVGGSTEVNVEGPEDKD